MAGSPKGVQPEHLKKYSLGLPGTPTGSKKGVLHKKDKLTKKYISIFCQDFREHGATVLARVRRDNPVAYMKLAADLLPRDIDVHHSGQQTIQLVSFLDVKPENLVIEGGEQLVVGWAKLTGTGRFTATEFFQLVVGQQVTRGTTTHNNRIEL